MKIILKKKKSIEDPDNQISLLEIMLYSTNLNSSNGNMNFNNIQIINSLYKSKIKEIFS